MTIDQARRRKAVARWHRRFALFIALWLIFLAATGVLINHSHELGLDRKPLAGGLQRALYGAGNQESDPCGANVDPEVDCREVFARLQTPGGSLLLQPDSLYLLDSDGQLVEKLTASYLGLGSLQAGLRDHSQIYLRDENSTVRVDTDLMEAVILEPAESEALSSRDWQINDSVTSSITWERLLLDLHAARFLGSFATVFTDLMAALILVLALSGMWLYRLKNRTNGNGSNGQDG
jgi:hypothetical protein